MNSSRRLKQGQVQFLYSGIFLCFLYQLTISAQLNDPLPVPQIGGDYGKGSKVVVEETTIETGILEEPLVATNGLKYNDQTTQKTLVGPFMDTSQYSQETQSIATPTTIPAGEVPDVINIYPADLFSVKDRRQGWVILHMLGLIYMFLALIIVCDEFFVPALEVIINKLAISTDVAGATFMAAGRSIPKFFSLLIGILLNHDSVNVGTIVGSAVFNILFVIGVCALFSREILHLTHWPLFRDASFYIFDLILLIIFFMDNVIEWWESLILVVSFILYGIFMKFNPQAEKTFKTQVCKQKSIRNKDFAMEYEKQNASGWNVLSEEDGVISPGDYGEGDDNENSGGPSEKEGDKNKVKKEKKDELLSLHWPDTRCKQARCLFLLPIILPLWLTLPDVRREESRKFFLVTYLVSILWFVVLSYFSMWWAHQVGETFGIPHVLILAAAATNPGLITSVIVARKGLGDMAVSSNVGANIFEIAVSLPLPWLLCSFIYGFRPVAVTSNGLVCATVLLFLMLFLAITTIMSCKWKMNKVLGSIMLLLYLLFVIVSVMLEYSFIVCPVGVGERD